MIFFSWVTGFNFTLCQFWGITADTWAEIQWSIRITLSTLLTLHIFVKSVQVGSWRLLSLNSLNQSYKKITNLKHFIFIFSLISNLLLIKMLLKKNATSLCCWKWSFQYKYLRHLDDYQESLAIDYEFSNQLSYLMSGSCKWFLA